MTEIPKQPFLLLCVATVALWVTASIARSENPHASATKGTTAPAGSTGAAVTPASEAGEQAVVPGPLEFRAPALAPQPAAGKGRLTLVMDGNRRWCTYRDDRVSRPPEMKGQRVGAPPPSRDEIYTFGYQFTIAAVERTHPAETLMLFESPVVRTAVMREAAKLGRGMHPPGSTSTPQMPDPNEIKTKAPDREMPSTLIPMWQEQFRCAKVPETIEFDLDPGIYDIYMAFDILLRSGGWAHRSIAYETDVIVRPDASTRLEGYVNMSGGAKRDFHLATTSREPGGGAAAGGR
jgi:hypothetical protein